MSVEKNKSSQLEMHTQKMVPSPRSRKENSTDLDIADRVEHHAGHARKFVLESLFVKINWSVPI